MPVWLISCLIIIGILVTLFGMSILFQHIKYGPDRICVTSTPSWSSDERYHSFNEVYTWHCNQNYHAHAVTRDIPFSTFKSLYTVNPEKWKFEEKLEKTSSNDFTLQYIIDPGKTMNMGFGIQRYGEKTIQVIFSKPDFKQFLYFIADLVDEKKDESKRKEDQASRDAAEAIIKCALGDIEALNAQAEEERAAAEETARAVAANLKDKTIEYTYTL